MPATEHVIPDEARREIARRLDRIEAEHPVRILYACESGSRAWGFASADSDFDVRFIYLSPRDWYLAVDLEERRDVIETPIEGVWDVNGWDLRKALRLYRKSNPPLLEWLQSPIVYREVSRAAPRMRELLARFYSPVACMYHYLHMAQGNYRGYLQSERVRTKKYFYVLRPLLGCRWIEQGQGAVPMEFERLVEGTTIPDVVQREITRLLEQKRTDGEIGEGSRNAVLSEFIEAEFKRHEAAGLIRQKPYTAVQPLNAIFRETLQEVWGDA
ncbi:MAG: nucleotidyltransferase domain-containing protein [Gammaproteobacteria bacterium]|nr:nucleotidyltransferase domain-containing protein [Gammaproteobacteria bacterium]